jgi:hypothetical protein
MNQDSQGFQLDVQAEQQAFSSIITPSEIRSPAVSVQADKQDLPSSVSYEPTSVNIATEAQADVAKTNINLQVKFDPEMGYKSLKSTVDGLQETVKSTVDNATNRWIPNPKAASKFEERPTLEQTNLIFEDRRERFSQLPKWS